MIKMRIPVFFLFLFFCIQQTMAQSRAEISWALKHPVAALRVKKITRQCDVIYAEYKERGQPDQLENGGRLDAFRHTFYMAAYAQKINKRKLVQLGLAHEAGNYSDFLNAKLENGEIPDFFSCEMDLYNNELGIKTGSENQELTLDSLAGLVVQTISEGRAVIMKRNKNAMYLKCSGEVLQLELYSKEWRVPKCLVNSDYQETD